MTGNLTAHTAIHSAMATVLQAGIALFLTLLAGAARATEPAAPLVLERRIPLPDVVGRIDHLSVDLGRGHLFVAELGNGTVDEIDLGTGKSIGRISGLKEPQGLAYVSTSDLIVVAGDPGRNQSKCYCSNHTQGPPVSRQIALPQNWAGLLPQR